MLRESNASPKKLKPIHLPRIRASRNVSPIQLENINPNLS